MSFIPTFPGVYIREIPSGSRSIAGASTSIAAFVGGFARGPVNTPVRLFSLADFDNEFGGLSSDYETSFAVPQFFVNGGGTAYAIRVVREDGANAAVAASVTMQDTAGTAVLQVTAGRQVGDTLVDDPGEWCNNLRIDVDYRTADPATQFNLFVSEIRDADGIETATRNEVYRNLTSTAGPRNAVDVVNAESRLITLTAMAAGRPAPTGYYSGDLSAVGLGGFTGSSDIDIDFGGGAETVTVDFGVTAPADLTALAAVMQAAIRAAAPTNRLFSQAAVGVVGTSLRVAPGRNSPNYDPLQIVSITDVGAGTLAVDLLLDAGNAQANVEQYMPNGAGATIGFLDSATEGDDGAAVNAAALAGNRGQRTSFYALDNVDAFNMLSIPESSGLGSTTNQSLVMAPALAYCVEKRAMLFIDPPPGTASVEAAEAWLGEIANAGLRSPNSVSYFPTMRVADPMNGGRMVEVAPSGTLAGIWARTDGETGVWKAPAGTTASLRGVPELTYVLSDPQNGVLNPQGLNALRSFDIPGNVSWGSRTLMGADLLASDWKYVPVRRTALFIESSLFNGLQWAVFQPNAEPLWLEIRGAVTAFMQGLFRQGAFKGTSPREAYIVRCGADTTTQADINAGIVNVFVGFAPLQPAEFVVVSLQLQLQQAN